MNDKSNRIIVDIDYKANEQEPDKNQLTIFVGLDGYELDSEVIRNRPIPEWFDSFGNWRGLIDEVLSYADEVTADTKIMFFFVKNNPQHFDDFQQIISKYNQEPKEGGSPKGKTQENKPKIELIENNEKRIAEMDYATAVRRKARGQHKYAYTYYKYVADSNSTDTDEYMDACYETGLYLKNGGYKNFNIEKSFEESKGYFLKAAKKSHLYASIELLDDNYYNTLSMKEKEKILSIICDSQESDIHDEISGEAWRKQGIIDETANHKKAAFKSFEKSHNLGDAEGTYRLGLCYYNGIGITKDYDEAICLYKKAMDKDCLDAILTMAFSSQIELKEKFNYFKKAYALGDIKSGIEMIILLFNNHEEISEDKIKAITIYDEIKKTDEFKLHKEANKIREEISKLRIQGE